MDSKQSTESNKGLRWRHFTLWVKSNVPNIPLIGPLFGCTLKNHLDSLKEFSVSIAFGTATFTVTALLLLGLTANEGASYWQLLKKTVETGQLYIFAVGMLGPILLTSAEDPLRSKAFPSRTFHIAFLILIAVLASGYYALFLLAKEPAGTEIVNVKFLFRMSLWLAAGVVTMRYLTIVYRKSTVDFVPERDMPKQTTDFTDDFAQRHGGEVQ
jgi:hypothetical protein